MKRCDDVSAAASSRSTGHGKLCKATTTTHVRKGIMSSHACRCAKRNTFTASHDIRSGINLLEVLYVSDKFCCALATFNKNKERESGLIVQALQHDDCFFRHLTIDESVHKLWHATAAKGAHPSSSLVCQQAAAAAARHSGFCVSLRTSTANRPAHPAPKALD